MKYKKLSALKPKKRKIVITLAKKIAMYKDFEIKRAL
jgi:hypothetical protein